jgi:hypothetical protein
MSPWQAMTLCTILANKRRLPILGRCLSRHPGRSNHVAPSVPLVAVRHPIIQSYPLLNETCTKHRLAVVDESANLVYICVRWDPDSIIWGLERDTVAPCSGWGCQDGRGPGPACDPNDCKCQPRCGRRSHAQGQCNVSPLSYYVCLSIVYQSEC